jgi:mannose-6-phosphate isomerase-like protein (cupin superfamily)
MLSFLATHPPRTKIAHLNPIRFDEGRSTVEFKSPSDGYLVINRLPPLASDEDVARDRVPNKSNCALAPPLHWHHSQEETFHVLEGTALFTLNGVEKTAVAAEVVIIPMRDVHTFRNASEETELVVEFVLDPSTRENDEAYFSNISPSDILSIGH